MAPKGKDEEEYEKPEQWGLLSIAADQASQALVEVSNLSAPLRPSVEEVRQWLVEAEGAMATVLDQLDEIEAMEGE